MNEALEIARTAFATGDVPVGAIVINKDGVVVGKGSNEREANNDPTAHAEIVAIRNAAARLQNSRLDGCTLVVTLEPCPMCAGAIVQSRIPWVVYGCMDPKAGACHSLFNLLNDPRLNHRSRVVTGVLENECSSILSEFFQKKRHNRKGFPKL